jgi:DNA polymerase V
MDLQRVTQPQKVIALSKIELLVASSRVQAGFPSPAESHIERTIDLNEWLVGNKLSTFLVKVEGDSMNFEFRHGDILIVDKSIEPKPGDVVIACIDDEFTVKRWTRIEDRHYLVASNPAYAPIEVTEDNDCLIWGVVTYAIHRVS